MAPTKEVLLSSPDPLGMSNGSIPSHPPTKEAQRLSITPRKALTEASGNTQVQEFYINTPPHARRNASPIKSPRQTTQSTSPWRIRLTVQAEQIDEVQKSNNFPGKRLTEQTTTITVPLKGCDDTPPVMQKKGRGRPRKSLDSPVKRAGTPKPKGGGRRKTMSESPKKREMDVHGQVATPPKKPRGRPRKSIESKGVGPSLVSSQSSEPDVWLGSSLVGGEEMTEMKPKATRTRSRARRQEITPMKISADSDIESQSSSVATAGETPKELAWTLGNGHDESDQVDQRLPESYEVPTPQTDHRLDSETSHGQSSFGNQSENDSRYMLHQNACSPSPHGDHSQDQNEPDPTGQPQEYDSILESEGFSMVSVSSLPSVGDDAISPPQQYGILHEHTPILASSPSVPPAPETTKIQSSPRHLETPSDGTPKLAKVLRAGVALQGALNTKDRSQELGSPFQESQRRSLFSTEGKSGSQRDILHRPLRERSPEVHLDDPFRGFGAGTRRELKAGLRLGEELAKRQRQTSRLSDVAPRKGDDTFQQTRDTHYPQLPVSDSKESHGLKTSGSESQVRYPLLSNPLLSNTQLPSPERSLLDEEEDRMSGKADTPIKQEGPTPDSAPILVSDETIGSNASTVDYTMMARQEEWQREREAVSKQIEMANKSRVIVIESDDEDNENPEDDAADSDIWQAEAHSVDQSRETTPGVSDILPQPELLKPRRSKIPSPWRRNSQVIYSDEVEAIESDLFWQPDQSQAKASKRRHAAKCQSEDRLNISADSVLDNSMENTRKAEAQIQLEASKALPVEASLLIDEEDRTTATSVDHPLDHGFIQDADQKINSPVAAMPSENHTVLELPPSPKLAITEDVIEVVENVETLKVMEGTSMEPNLQTSKDGKAAIDPRLLQKKTRPPNAPRQAHRPINPLPTTQASTSWLSRLTTPIWSVFAPAAPLPPAATKEDILCSSLHEPLCQFTPWEECHFRALGPLYYSSLLYGAHLFPFNPRSPSARFCGASVTTKLGWSRKVTPEDCGITDAFMILLDERGFALGEPGARWIDESIVIGMCVRLWMGMIKRGEIEVDRSKGERTGLRDQGDRKWTKDDIDWTSNETAYFERKRREFDGLPSWKNKD